MTGSTFEPGICPGYQVNLLFQFLAVPEQGCPFCGYPLTLEHVTYGCEFVDAAVCCEPVGSYGWEYFLQPSTDLELLRAKVLYVGRSTAKVISAL